MRSRAILFLVIGCAYFPVAAQSDSTDMSGSTWFISLHSGILAGATGNGSSASATLLQGVRYHKLSMGVGIGYDGYFDWQAMPVFVGIGYDFVMRKNHAWFAHVNTGYSKVWNSIADQQQMYFSNEGGYFYHPSIGYRLRQGKLSIYFSAGYKVQRIDYKAIPRWLLGGGAGVRSSVEQKMERLSIQMGIGLR